MHKIKNILSFTQVYQLYQWLVGAQKYTRLFAHEYIRYQTGQKILDIGCGPADILKHLPKDVDYTGLDINPDYIIKAQKKYPDKLFLAGNIEDACFPLKDESFDTIFFIGVQHHLNDESVTKILRFARGKLKDGGRLLALEPVRTPGQRFIERWFMNNDRGKFIRNEHSYQQLTQEVFPRMKTEIIPNTMNIPFTIIITEAFKE